MDERSRRLANTSPFDTSLRANGQPYLPHRHLGCIICVVNLVSIVPITGKPTCWKFDGESIVVPPPVPEFAFGDYTPERFAWILSNVRRLPVPLKKSGSRKLWEVSDYEIQRALKGLVVATER